MQIRTFLFRAKYVPAILVAFMMAPMAHAATSPSLGAADSYSVLSGTGATNAGATTITGDVGVSPAASYTEAGTTTYLTAGNPHLADTSAANAQLANTAAFGAIDQGCTQSYAGVKDLTTVSPLVPGVYCADAFILTGNLTLTGTGVWIFKSASTIITSPGSSVTGGNACDIWWRAVSSVTLDTTTAFKGNVLASTQVSLMNGATVQGRVFAQTAAVTMIGNTITKPTCTAAATPPATLSNPAPIINVRKVPSPLTLPAGPGSVTYNYTVTNPSHVILTNVTLTDDKCSAVNFLAGDTNSNGWLEESETWTYSCTMNLTQTTVNYVTARGIGNGLAAVDTAVAEVFVGVPVVPPLIHIIKTPNPSLLPFNGGSVAYSYVVTNPSTVALTAVTVVDNKCSNVTLVSGDTNRDAKLQPTETWRYTCTMNIPQTMTNTVVATGHANGLTAIDTALATVVVEGSPIPPLIHIIKKPDPIVLPASGGLVTYAYSVTNPGTVPLESVSIADDKCGPVNVISGDANGNTLLDLNETWAFTCQQTLRVTTSNTATATGKANGLTVTDVAVANVVLSPALLPAAPKLPNTGFNPGNDAITWAVAAAGLFVAITLLRALTHRKRLS